jgi:serine/threonine-protein kinase
VTLPAGTDPALQPGTIVGEYQITHLLGEGGMGVVYAGTHPEIGKRVAIKVLAPSAAQHPDLIRRFKEEARAVNKIRHPNIIDIFAFNQLPDGRHYFVMEYLDGENLTARLERGSMEFAEMRRLLGQICAALQAAHEAGVVHRDLKPDNIWVATQANDESRIKLLDFGIAKLNDLTTFKGTQAGVAIGTPHYMPPEQGMGRPIDRRADIYALGVVLYQIFAGTLPFDGATAHEVVLKHVTETPSPPSSHRPIAPAAMERIILDCLEKEPERRPASARELGTRIDAAFAAEIGSSAPAGDGTKVPRLPAVAAPGLTMPMSDRVPGMVAAQPRSSTTLRGSTGERIASAGDPSASEIAVVRGRGWRLPAAGVAAAAIVAFVVVVVRGRQASEPHLSAAATSAAAADPAASSPSPPTRAVTPDPPAPGPAPPAEKPAVALAPATSHPAPAKAPAVATASETSPRARPNKHERQKQPAIAKSPATPREAASPAKAATSPPPAAAKPNCNPNFYLDAQGDKHFKRECF